jgi:selenocysteine lyase/cysteine desulfurase
LVQHGRAQGSLVGVDITQGVGILPFDVQAADADFIVGSTLKWLCGVAGAAVLQVREGLLQECRPELRGWFSQQNPFAWALDSFEYARDARRFDHGTPSILACAACLPALDWHAKQEAAELLAHNRRLADAVLEGCAGLGLELVSPASAEERGGSVMFRLPPGCEPDAIVAGLRKENVFVDCRGMTLRVSPGNVTTSAGVDRLLRVLRGTIRP